MWNILDSIPIVGHVKGVVHYATGDVDAGNRAMLQSTRSTTVLGAGAVGFVAGPVGSAALGASAGALWDCAESVATDKPKGLIKDIGNIVDTAAKGEVPVVGVLQTVITVSGDALGGLGGGSMANSVTKAAGQSAAKSVGKSVGKSTGEQILKSASVPAGETFGKSIAQSAGKSVAKSAGKNVAKAVAIEVVEDAAEAAVVVTTQAIVKAAKENLDNAQSTSAQSQNPPPGASTGSSTGGSNSSRTSGQSRGNTTGPPGGNDEPPRQNPRTTCSTTQALEGSPWDEFFEIFNVQSLAQITIEDIRLFEGLEDHQIAYLQKLLRGLLDKKLLARVIKILLNILKTMNKRDIHFLNFISLCEFIMQYLEEQMKRLQEQRANAPGSFSRIKNEIIRIVDTTFNRHDCTILNLFREIRSQIGHQTLLINFRDVFCAVYHYFKHRQVGTCELSVPDYYGLINTNLRIIMGTREYQNLLNRGRPPIRYMRYYQIHGTRLLIIVKVQDGKVVLSSAYFRDKREKGDKEGDKYINGRKM